METKEFQGKNIEDAISQSDNEKLRADFCSLVDGGQIILPGKLGKNPHCSECSFKVPKLEYKEWVVAHNGTGALNGVELQIPQTA